MSARGSARTASIGVRTASIGVRTASVGRSVAVWARRSLARRPWIHWLAVVALAAGVAGSVWHGMRGVAATRSSWGESVTVLVANADLAPGDPITVERRTAPVAIVPPSAVATVAGLRARQHIGTGEIVTSTDVVSGAGALALVPSGWLAVPVIESPRSGADVGDRVAVASDGITLADEAIVVGFVDDATLVAVTSDRAPLLPAAAAASGLTLLRRP
jgi:hypothetical protein